MSTGARIAAAVASGYLLGRTKRFKLAITVGSMLAGQRIATDPRGLMRQGQQLIDSNAELSQLSDQVRTKLFEAARAAAIATAASRLDNVSDLIRERTERLGLPAIPEEEIEELVGEVQDEYGEEEPEASEEAEAEPEEAEPEVTDEAEEAEPEEAERPRRSEKGAAKKSSARKAAAKKSAPAKKTAAKKTSAGRSAAKKSAPAKKSAAKKTSASKSAAKKSAPAKKSTAKKSSTSKKSASSRSRSTSRR